jgi:hypothetical protein
LVIETRTKCPLLVLVPRTGTKGPFSPGFTTPVGKPGLKGFLSWD